MPDEKKKNLDFLRRVVEVVEGRGRTAPLTPAPRAGPLASAITSPQSSPGEGYLFADFTEEDLAGLGYSFAPGLTSPPGQGERTSSSLQMPVTSQELLDWMRQPRGTTSPKVPLGQPGQPGEGQPPGEPEERQTEDWLRKQGLLDPLKRPGPDWEWKTSAYSVQVFFEGQPTASTVTISGWVPSVFEGEAVIVREIGGHLLERQPDKTWKDVTPEGVIKAKQVTEDTYRVTNADGSVDDVTYLLDETGRFQKDETGKPIMSRTVRIGPPTLTKAKRPLTAPGPQTYADPQGNTWRKTWEWDRESEQFIPQESLIESAGDFETRQQRARQLQEDLYLTREREARESQGKYNTLAYALSQMPFPQREGPGEEGAAPLLQRPGGLQETLRRILSQGGVFPGEINRQAGVVAPYIDTPRGRIFGGTQEYNQLIQAGARPTFQGSIGKLGQVGTPNYWEWQRMLPSQREGLESSYEGMGVPRGDIGAAIEGAFEAQRQTTYNPEIGKFWGEFMRRQEEEKRQREMASLGAVERRRSPFWQR